MSVTVILQWERKANLARFEGSLSISSADYFGTGNSHNSSSGSHLTTPDLEDVKESVRQGVTKVAGKLSSIANGVMSTIQVSRWFEIVGLFPGYEPVLASVIVAEPCVTAEHFEA